MSPLLATCLVALFLETPAAKPSAVAVAPTRPAPAAAPALTGTVTDTAGKPIVRALVMVRSLAHEDEPALTARTDDQGGFRIMLTSGGLVTARIEATGFAPQVLEKREPGTPLRVQLAAGAWIRGVVRDGATRNPIEGALVQCHSPGGGGAFWEAKAGLVETRTDAQGRFRLDGLGTGRQFVRATARGYGAQSESSVRPGTSVEFFLSPGAAILGTVRDAEGRPVAGALVEVVAASGPGFRMVVRPEETDVSGHFEVLGLDPGEYRVLARHRELAPAVSGAVSLAQGGEDQVDLVLQPGVMVTGRLVGRDQKPAGGSVTLAEVDGQSAPTMLEQSSRCAAGADGLFRLTHVPAGRHVLGVVAPGFTPQRVEVTVGNKPVDVGDVALEPGLVIQGRVTDGSGTAVADAELEATPAALDRRVYDQSPQRSSRSDATGRFVLGGLSEGTYEVKAQAYGFGRLVRPIEAGAKGVTLVLAPAGSITGVAVDEAANALTGYRVVAQVNRSEGDLRAWQPPYFKSVTAADGRFVLEGVSAGTYRVDVSAPERVSASVKDVQVQSGSASDVGRVVLRAGGSVRGSVVDTAGASVAGAQVTVPGGSGLPFVEAPKATTNGEGAFTLRGLAPGQVEIAVSHPLYAEARAGGIEVDPASGPADVRIVLGQGARVQGSVRQRDGSPIPGVTIQLMPLGPDDRPRRSSTRYSAETSSDGAFSIERLPAGRAMLFLMGGARHVQTSAQTRSVELREAQATTVDFVLSDVRVTGILTRLQVPVANANLRFQPQGQTMTMMMSTSGGSPTAPGTVGPMRNQAITGADGRFELLVDNSGRYSVSVSSADGKATVYRTVEIPDAESHDLQIELGGSTVNGIVLEKGTERPLPAARLSFLPVKGGSGFAHSETGADGRFQVDLEPGSYTVQATLAEFAPAQLELEVPAAGETRILLSPGSALEGKVVDEAGRGVGGLDVRAFAFAGENAPPQWARSLPDGSFRLSGLLAQPYTLLADAGESGRFAVAPGVQPGDRPAVLVLRPAARVIVRMIGPDGKPVPGAHALVSAVDGAKLTHGNATNSDAGGVIEMLAPAGQLQIRAFKQVEPSKERLAGSAVVIAAPGATSAVDVQLMQGPQRR